MSSKGIDFENEVRRIARALWPCRPGSGAAVVINHQERDCIFEDEYVTHYIEVTTSRKLDKVKHDVKKMIRLRTDYSSKGKLVKLWIITKEDPTPDQVEHCKRNNVEIMNIKQFRRNVIDGTLYNECRIKYTFGSAANPENDSTDLSSVEYLPVKIFDETEKSYVNIKQIAEIMQDRSNIVILMGDYGMGKSINIYQMYKVMSKKYRIASGQALLPVVLNLREHWGQSSPEEALRRHGEKIGFSRPDQLVRAFNAGRLAVVLDGFDEIAGTPWTRHESAKATAIRIGSVELVRNFVDKSKGRNSLLIAGREHYFNTRAEMEEAFHTTRSDVIYVRLDEFSDSEAREYLKKHGYRDSNLPNWLPKRPLLLASLTAKDILTQILEQPSDLSPESAWDNLLHIVCEREAKIHKRLSTSGIRSILELLANQTRSSAANTGPITESHIAEAFRSVVGNYPDESARVLLHRLPCLASRNEGDGKRNFLDDQMLDVLRAGSVHRFIQNPYNKLDAKDWQNGLGTIGVSLVALKAGNENYKLVEIAVQEALSRWNSPTLAMDCIQVRQHLTPDEEEVSIGSHVVVGATCECFDLLNLPVVKQLDIQDSIIGQLIMPLIDVEGIEITGTAIEEIIGISRPEDLPEWIRNYEIAKYDTEKSNATILEESRQPVSIRVMLTILRKIYVQKGDGRRQETLYRGMSEDNKRYVMSIIEILANEGLIMYTNAPGTKIWHAVSGQRRRAMNVIKTYGKTDDPVTKLVSSLVL